MVGGLLPDDPAVKVGVVGHPIGQSKSPLIHNHWLAEARHPERYGKIDPGAGGFAATVEEARANGWRGLNVTLPFKSDAFAIADQRTAEAEAIGTANLLIFRDGKVLADNTDARGFAAGAMMLRADWHGAAARVIGAGGAAPAVLHALLQLGFTRVEVANRTLTKANDLKDRFEGVTTISWEERDQGLGTTDLVVNVTSLGMVGQPPLTFSVADLPSHASVIDIITTPKETPLLAAAKARGLATQNGLPMLVHQAAPSFEAWFGEAPQNVEAMIHRLQGEGA